MRCHPLPIPLSQPTVRSWAPGRRRGRHLLAQRLWAWPSLVWAERPHQVPWATEVVVQASAGADPLPPRFPPYAPTPRPALLGFYRAHPGSFYLGFFGGYFGLPVSPLSHPRPHQVAVPCVGMTGICMPRSFDLSFSAYHLSKTLKLGKTVRVPAVLPFGKGRWERWEWGLMEGGDCPVSSREKGG